MSRILPIITACGCVLLSYCADAGIARAGDSEDVLLTARVSAGEYDRPVGSPVFLELPEALRGEENFDIKPTKLLVPYVFPRCQRIPGEDRICWSLEQELRAGETREYVLRASSGERGDMRLQCTDNGEILVFGNRSREQPALKYNHATRQPPEGIDPIYARSGYVHPLNTPDGLQVTGDFAPDHAHQHALFFAWVNTTFRGRRVDFWNQLKSLGDVRHEEVLGTHDGPVFAQCDVRLRHFDKTGEEPEDVLDEIWTLRLFDVGDGYLLDLISKQTCIADEPLTINEYHYGGFGMRGNTQWLGQPENDFLTSEGCTREDGNHTRPTWVDLHGKTDGRMCGVTIMGSPDNFRYPQPVRLHPEKPYFCFAPQVLGEFQLKPNEEYVSRYRLYIHDGPADVEKINAVWSDYANPVKVETIE